MSAQPSFLPDAADACAPDLVMIDGRLHRTRLERIFDHTPRTGAVIMMNASTAGPRPTDKNDPTIWRLIEIGRALGFGRWIVANLDTLVSPDPADLWAWHDSLAPEQLMVHREQVFTHILEAVSEADPRGVFAAWGKWRAGDDWPQKVRSRLHVRGIELRVFGLNADGSPRHPLARGRNRIPADVKPIRWPLSLGGRNV